MNQAKIRSFVIIAHIDHGKSTLADRFLELTKTIPKDKMHPQYLDSLELEREKQITIKLAPVRMEYTHNSESYTLNLIDTPGHVDFSYEVSRSLAAVEGAVLLVDAVKGIQAQTLAVLEQAQNQGLKIIPVINKIDLLQAETAKRQKELSNLLEIPTNEVLKISAKTGKGVGELLEKIIELVPPPIVASKKDPLKALIFDSLYDPYRGVIIFVRIIAGVIKKEDNMKFVATDTIGKTTEVGIFKPQFCEKSILSAGEIGYIITNLKDPDKCQVGDTIGLSPIPKNFKKLPGYLRPQPNIFATLFSTKGESAKLKQALTQLKLTDSALEFKPQVSPVLGAGLRCGFLGMLHLEIIRQRLEREYDLDLLISAPSVSYNIIIKSGEKLKVNNPEKFPQPADIKEILQPIMSVEILVPNQFLGTVSEFLKQKRAKLLKSKFLEKDRSLLIYEIPLSQIVWDFYDKLKSITSGLGSYNYKFLDYKPADLVKLDVIISGEKFPAFSQIVFADNVHQKAKKIVLKLKKIIPRQLFEVVIQAAIGSKILARENIPPLRKDVIAKLYGGDYTRKMKLLKKQKAGKKKMKSTGKIILDKEVFWKFLK